MTRFEDQLLSDLMTEHGAQLRQLPPRLHGVRLRGAPLRTALRPAWLAAGAAMLAGAVTATIIAVGGAAPAYAGYAVTRGADGTVTVAVSRPAGVAGANAALQHMRARVRVVPVRPGCPSIFSLPHPQPPRHHHGGVSVMAGRPHHGHRSVSVKVWGNSIPAGATLLLAFSTPRTGLELGAGVLVTGHVPSCVSLPARPGGGLSAG